jgi:hypothetical protein
MPEIPEKMISPGDSFWKRRGWKKVLSGFTILLILLLALSPEIAVFSFLLDAAVIETLIFLVGMQLQSYYAGIVLYVSSTGVAIARRLGVIRAK